MTKERAVFHKKLLTSILTIDKNGVVSNADSHNRTSLLVAQKIREKIIDELHNEHLLNEDTIPYTASQKKLKGQTMGTKFEELVMNYLEATFSRMSNIRPGKWHFLHLGNQSQIKASSFSQYEHLAYLSELVKANTKLSTALGNDYVVAPDVIIYRDLYEDEELNTPIELVDDASALKADLRKKNGGKPVLHASVSAKWTMRSDRAQNSRTEALNLIRNRKGNLPHIVVVTGEPAPSRLASLASLALGTGDIDCMYHFALYELVEAVQELANDDTLNLLTGLIDGKRLKDISDLPLDLSV